MSILSVHASRAQSLESFFPLVLTVRSALEPPGVMSLPSCLCQLPSLQFLLTAYEGQLESVLLLSIVPFAMVIHIVTCK